MRADTSTLIVWYSKYMKYDKRIKTNMQNEENQMKNLSLLFFLLLRLLNFRWQQVWCFRRIQAQKLLIGRHHNLMAKRAANQVRFGWSRRHRAKWSRSRQPWNVERPVRTISAKWYQLESLVSGTVSIKRGIPLIFFVRYNVLFFEMIDSESSTRENERKCQKWKK